MAGYYRQPWPCWACVHLAAYAMSIGRAVPCWICGRVHGRDQDWAARPRDPESDPAREAKEYAEGCRP